MESIAVRCPLPCKKLTWRVVMVMGIATTVVFVFHSFVIFHGSVWGTLFPPADKLQMLVKGSHGGEDSVTRSMRVGEFSLLSNTVVLGVDQNSSSSKTKRNMEIIRDTADIDRYPDQTLVLEGDNSDDEISLMKDGDPDDDSELNGDTDDWFPLEMDKYTDDFAGKNHQDPGDSSSINNVIDVGDNFTFEVITDRDKGLILEKAIELERESSQETVKNSNVVVELDSAGKMGTARSMVLRKLDLNSSDYNKSASLNVNFTSNEMAKNPPKVTGPQQTNSNMRSNIPIVSVTRRVKGMLPLNISEMNHLLLQRRVSSHPAKPRWPSALDKELLSAKKLIENAPILKDDDKLYAPAYRNISMFKRSYELMERILKVYVYKEGAKPIFHKPLLKGIYASEGWFMKLMEGNKRYIVKDPRKAHLFYLPFSSRLLQLALYVPRSHDHKNLIAFLKNYIDKISVKYPFWNRTSGADHFLVACHDWAPAETRHNMEHSVRVLCNSDLFNGFKLGRDVSLPETYVRSGQNPLRDLGGEPPSKRPTLAFYAGNMHGSLRPILLHYWENRDPNMKIIGPMHPGVESKMTYIRHMKTSKYCICPRGHGVNSPRVVEAIFYECVPVIISDNYIPPFFEVLNWEEFSVFIAEKDVPKLKDILISIPEERYLIMQMGVKKVQQHFLWHSTPVKYDIFHMILHSVWFNRLHQIRI